MDSLFGSTSTGVDWSTYTPDAMAYTPNAAPVPVNTPAVSTGGQDWQGWFDRLVGVGLAIRNGGTGGDARVTTYPGTGMQGAAYAGQPVGASNMLPMLMLGGMMLAAWLVLKG